MQPNENDDDQNLDVNQDDKSQQGAPSGDQNQDLNLDDNQGQGNQDDDDSQGDQGQERQSRQERRRERLEAFQAARNGYQQTDAQRQQALRRDPYNPLKYDKGVEYDVDQLEKDRAQYGDSRYAQGIEQQRFYDQQDRYYDRLEIDGEFVANRYPFLDEESDEFDPDLAENINNLFFEAAGYDKQTHLFRNPTVRYKAFVQRYVKAMEKYASTRNAESTQNLSDQRSRTGIRPTNGGRKPVDLTWGDPSKMSDAELEAHIKAGLS